MVAVSGLAIRNAQLEQQRDAETAQAAQLARVLRAAETPGVQHATLSTPDGQTMAAVLLHNDQRDLSRWRCHRTPATTLRAVGHRQRVTAGDRGVRRGPTDTGLHQVGEPPQGEDYTGYAISLEPGQHPAVDSRRP